MNRFHLILICLLLIAGALFQAMSRPEPANGHGVPHPDYSSMSRGGDPERHSGLWTLGWTYGAGQLVLYALWLTLGLKRGTEVRAQWSLWLGLAAAAYLAVFTALMVTYVTRGAEPGAILGLPTSTALLIFGMWATPCLFTLLYVRNFDRWIYGSEDAARFAARSGAARWIGIS